MQTAQREREREGGREIMCDVGVTGSYRFSIN